MSMHMDKELTAEDFRQNYVPEPAMEIVDTSRHWLLDNTAGRDLLKLKLLKMNRHSDVTLWGEGKKFDGHLNRMVDELNLRDLAKPEFPMDVLKFNFKIVKMMVAVQFGHS